jgi:hypothetical protein
LHHYGEYTETSGGTNPTLSSAARESPVSRKEELFCRQRSLMIFKKAKVHGVGGRVNQRS